jgi:hypothetical protein
MTFNEFMQQVDAELDRISNLTSDDLADYMYRDAFDNEEDPVNVAVEVLINNDFPQDLL